MAWLCNPVTATLQPGTESAELFSNCQYAALLSRTLCQVQPGLNCGACNQAPLLWGNVMQVAPADIENQAG
jgi:hypothetical protein